MPKSKAKTIRLSMEDWAEVEYAASLHGHGVNDEIKERIHALAVEVPPEVAEGQQALFDAEAVAQPGE